MKTGMKFLRAVWPLEDAMPGGDISPRWSVAVDPCTVPRDQLAVTEGVSASSVHSPVERWGLESGGPYFSRHWFGEKGESPHPGLSPYLFHVLRGSCQQSVTRSHPLPGKDHVLSQAEVLQPRTHSVCAPLGKGGIDITGKQENSVCLLVGEPEAPSAHN